MTKVFIGNLPDAAKGSDVEDFFHRFGRIREINLKSGYGFVEFEDKRDAEDAVHELNGGKLVGERVTIEIAGTNRSRSRSRSRDRRNTSYWDTVDRGERRRDERRDGRRGGGLRKDRPHRTQWAISIDNLSSRCSWASLKDYCRKYGEVTYTDAHFRSGEGKGEVCFGERHEMERALDELHGADLMGKIVKVTRSYNDGNRTGGGRVRSRSRSYDRHRGRDRPHRTPFTLAVENLSSRCDWSQLKDIMRRAGEVCYVDAHNRMGRGRGECCFATREIMYKAKDELNGYEINGKKIQLVVKEDGSVSRSPNRSTSHSRSRSRSRSRNSRRGRYSRSRSRDSRSRSRS